MDLESLKRYKGAVFLSVFAAVVETACSVVPYFAAAGIIGLIIAKETAFSAYSVYILIAFAGLLLSVVFHALSTVVSHNLAFRIIEEKRKTLAEKLERVSMGEVEKRSSGQWSQFMVETLDRMEQPIAHVIPEVAANLLIPVVLIVIIFILDWRMGVANLITIPLGLLFSALMMRGYKEKSQRYMDASKRMNTGMVEYVNGIKVIKAFNRSASSFDSFRECVEENRNAMLDWYLSVCFSITASQQIIPASTLFVLPAGLFLFMNDAISTQVFVTCMLLSCACYKPLLKAMGYSETLANIKVVNNEINQVMEIPEMERGETEQPVSSAEVEFRNVDFSYLEGQQVLNNISFTAEERCLTAIVGNSGGGKSTLAKLLAGFWNPCGGEILIGGKNLSDMPLKQNMDLVSYVSQENFLFNRTILENLKMAKEDATAEEVENACRKAGIHSFIMTLPDGYQTLCGEGGAKLSGGEKQRLSLARSFLKDSPIVLLDEATAYSDPDNERIIQQSIDRLVKDKTVIMIAHRLGTIKDADKIVVVDNGQVLEEGTHDSLLKAKGRYSEMWSAYMETKEQGADR